MDLLIQNIKKLIHIYPEEESIIKNLFTELSLNEGDYLLREGKICRNVAFIKNGLLRYFIIDDGNEKTIYFNKENEFVCNYQSFLPKISSDMSIQALEKTTVYVISYENLQKFYSAVKEGERFGRLVIEFIFLSAMKQLKSTYTDPPEIRYKHFLSTYPELVQRIPQYYIASYVGVKPQSLSRIRKRIAHVH